MHLNVRYIAPSFIFLLLAVSSALAQTATSRISGTVADEVGAVIAGAKVTAKNEATTVVYDTTTTTAGTYSLLALPPGQYTLTVAHPGFQTFSSLHNDLNVGAPLVIDVSLKVGAVAEVVEVVANYARIESSNAMLSGLVTRREILDLPLNGRNPLNLITLEPGLVQRTTNGAGSGTHVFGSRDRAHNLTIDGIDSNESSVPNPQSNLYRLNPDNVQEYRVVTHNATPEFGRNSGANVTIATRSGGNQYHGDAFWFHRDTALNANEWFNNAKGQPKPTLLLNQWGGDFGGPILKEKTFFFFSYQGNRINQTQPISSAFGAIPSVFTPTLSTGVFRYFVADPANPLVINGVTVTRNSPLLVDPRTGALRPDVPLCSATLTRRCVASYSIPANDPLRVGLDPTITALIRRFPAPNDFSVGDGLNVGGFSWNPPSRFVGPHFLGRIDHKFNENNILFGRYIPADFDTKQGDFLNSRPSVFPGFPPLGEVFRSQKNLAIGYRRVFSPTLVNEFTMGFSKFSFFFSLRESNEVNGNVAPPYAQACFGTSSFRDINTPFCNTPHTFRAVSNIQFIDNLGYVRGAHSFRTGFNFRLYRHNDERGVPGGFNMAPTIVFDRLVRSPLNENPAWTLPPTNMIFSTDRNNLQNAIAELTGLVATGQQAFQADFKTNTFAPLLFTLGTRAKQFDFYFQDEWKLKRNLTVNYGLRWEINLPPTDGADRVFVPDRAVDGSQGPVTYVKADRWFKRNNLAAIAPRLSFAWSPWGDKTVIRAGYGIAFDTISTFQVTSIGGKVPGSVLQCVVRVQDSAAQSAPCTDLPNDVRLTRLLSLINPFSLGTPTATPNSQLGPANKPLGVAPNVGAFDPNLKVPTVHEWSFTIQRELPLNIVAQIGYIGKRGMRLYRAYDLNQIRTDQPGLLDSFLIAQQNVRRGCQPDGTGCPAGIAGVAPALLLRLVPAATLNGYSDFALNGLGDMARRIDQTDITARGFPANYFRPNPQFSELFYFDSGGSSSYHGMIVQLRRRFEKGLDLGLSYTYSKSIDDMSVDPVAATSGGGLSSTNSRTPSDVRNFRLDRSLSDFDNRHVLVINGLYDLPIGKGQRFGNTWPGFVNHILGGWTGSGVLIRQSGEPFTINSGIRTANGAKVSRADLRGDFPSTDLKSAPGIQGPVVWQVGDLIIDPTSPNYNCRPVLNTQSFFCIPPAGGNGIGRNTAQGPGYWNLDMGIVKKFSLTEQVRLQFRAEFFNALNHPNFENPRNASSGSPTVTSSLFGQTCCITSAVPSASTVIATGEPNRVIQFALRLSF